MEENKFEHVRVHIVRRPSEQALAHLKERLDESIRLTFGKEIPERSDYQILVDGVPSRDKLEASPDLRYLIIPWAGLQVSTRDLLLDFPQVSVHNLHHNAVATAEMALTLLFAAAKFVVPMDQALRRNDWTPRYRPNPSVLLQNKTVLVLGYGAIGRHLGQVLKAMGLRVIGIRRNPKPDAAADVYPVGSLDQFLPVSDILVVTVPLTPETEGLIGEREIDLLPSGSIIINVGRGAVIDQNALYQGLKSNHILAAGLDVWYNYPADEDSRQDTPPANFPFHELENLVLSPHRGGGTRETELLRMEALALSLNMSARGESIPNLVNLQAGY